MNPYPIVWLATGLSPQVTGIERFVLDFGNALRQEFPNQGLLVVTEPGELFQELRAEGFSTASSAHLPRVRPPAEVVHNFGNSFVAWPRRHGLFTVHDWGAFTDGGMKNRARLRWGASIVLHHNARTHVHYVSGSLPESRPRLIRRPGRFTVCPPSDGSSVTTSLAPPAGPLFIGTASPRKRLEQLAFLAKASRIHVQLVGEGTASFMTDWTRARGRVSNQEKLDALRAASCLVLISEIEGFGIPVMEAARLGIRSVVSREVHEVLPNALQRYCHVIDISSPSEFSMAVAAASADRGLSAYSARDAFRPLLNLYRTWVA